MSSSRYRDDAATIFDVFCEIGAASNGEQIAPILSKYPDDFNEPSILKSIQQFAFPCPMRQTENEAVQLFSFVLTDSTSMYSFGFCRYTPRNDTCICLLSGFFWPNVFYKALNEISLVMNTGSQSDLDTILTRIYHTDIPNPGDVLKFNFPNASTTFEVKIPDLSKLPSLREDKYMLEFYNAVSSRQLIAIYSSLLKERRIIFTGRKLSQLSSCIHACGMLLSPMFWQSVFIPVLPACLSDMVMAPMPYLIGIPKQVLDISQLRDIGDVVVIDVDEKTLESPFDDVSTMPNEVVSFLKSQLKATTDLNDSFAKIFLRANVILFGDYRSGFTRDKNDEIIWKKEKFISEQKQAYQPYLSSLLGTDGVQYLERFIHDRLEVYKQGYAIGDLFELEVENMDLKNKQVRDNASDVIGVLKDKVSGIQIANRFNKLTPKEIRKAVGKLKTNGSGFNAMSFENVQWETPRNIESDISTIELQRTDEIPTANLIDFESPVSEQATNDKWSDLIRGEPNNSSHNSNHTTHVNVFADPFSLLDNPTSNSSSSSVQQNHIDPGRSNWEKFD